MKLASLAVCALGGILMLVGCNSLDLGLNLVSPGLDAVANVRVMDGAPDTVALTLQETLKRRGFEVTVVKDADTLVVESKTSAGLRFGLVLKSVQGPDGREQTRVALEWLDSRQDHDTSVQLFSEIDRQAGTKKQ
jgi:hypothetical protein